MVINCVKKTGSGSSKRDGRRSDVLSRDSKMSPGKVTKGSPTKLRAKAATTKPISLTIKYSDDINLNDTMTSNDDIKGKTLLDETLF